MINFGKTIAAKFKEFLIEYKFLSAWELGFIPDSKCFGIRH